MPTPEPLFDLLTEPLLGIRLKDGTRTSESLPEVLERLGRNEIAAFTALQVHQRHALHAFLVQLAAIAMHRAGRSDPVAGAATWRNDLLASADGQREAFFLVVPDLSKPAFMQPPMSEKSLNAFKGPFRQPDAIDVLVTAKNHDVKAARITQASPEHWAFSLLSLQTMQGFLGAGNYGIARMNGGFASRPSIGFIRTLSPGVRFIRDAALLYGARPDLVDRYGFAKSGGHALLWLLPWNGTESLALQSCDPYFVEVCRRVRLTSSDVVAVTAWTTSTKAPRIAAREMKGDTGDPWTPVDQRQRKALTVSGRGFSYELVQSLLFHNDYEHGVAGRLVEMDGESPLFVASVLVRGQGETDGLHERVVPIPGRIKRLLFDTGERAGLGLVARDRVQVVADVKLKVLKPALCALLQADPPRLNLKDSRPNRWLDRLDAEIDDLFFPSLWEAVNTDPEAAQRTWARIVAGLAQRQLEAARESVPLPDARRYRAYAAADRVFFGARKKHLPHLSETKGDAA